MAANNNIHGNTELFCVYSLMLDLVISSPWILIYQILPFVSTFHWPGKISNGCDRQGGCGKAVWRKISCFEWFCIYSLMLDLVVSTPWILIYQILPFVSTFGLICCDLRLVDSLIGLEKLYCSFYCFLDNGDVHIACFEWFCVYSLMLDLVASTPWILIYQILQYGDVHIAVCWSINFAFILHTED
ncbi:hypothetical protein D0Y65_039268 [Glycine soja]|uniref:Uncharacterized protein n=1 Tax=Glycine soja TaxID=3848 RepID=A0A445H8F0_GLYSO|nr:hypothetical protein D0Y65_039268 [Glycine soja]